MPADEQADVLPRRRLPQRELVEPPLHERHHEGEGGGERQQHARAERHERQGEQEQDRVGRQDDVHRHPREDEQDADDPQQDRPHDEAEAGCDEPAAVDRHATARHETDRDTRERREQDRGASIDDRDPRRGIPPRERLGDPQQMRCDHADDGETSRKVHTADALRTVQAHPARGEPARGYGWRSSHTRSAFWACRRFSASSHTTLWGPSMTSASTSYPRSAGRQWMKIASGRASAMTSLVTL